MTTTPPDDEVPTQPDYAAEPSSRNSSDTDWITPVEDAGVIGALPPPEPESEQPTESMPELPEPAVFAEVPSEPAATLLEGDDPAAVKSEPIPVEPSDSWDVPPAVEPADLPPPATPKPAAARAVPEIDDEEIDLATPPPVDPTAPGSGWFDISSTRLTAKPPAPSDLAGGPLPGAPAPSGSDLFAGNPSSITGPGSDVIRGLFSGTQPGPESHIFGGVPVSPPLNLDGGEPEETPTEDEIVTDPLRSAPSDVLLGVDQPSGPLGPDSGRASGPPSDFPPTNRQSVEQLFRDLEKADIPIPPQLRPQARSSDPGSDPHAPDFNELDRTQSGSNLFADPTVPDMALPGGSELLGPPSGLDLSNPLAGPMSGKLASGPRSSIFSQDDDDADGMVDVNQIPKLGSSDDATEAFPLPDRPPPSHIFTDIPSSPLHDMLASGIHKRPSPSGSDKDVLDANAGAVSFDLPKPPADATGLAEASGMIDWSVPPQLDDDLPPASQIGPGLLDHLAKGLDGGYRPGGANSELDLSQPESMFELDLGEEAVSISGIRRRSSLDPRRPTESDDLTLPTGPDGIEAPLLPDPAETTDPAEMTDLTPSQDELDDLGVMAGPPSVTRMSAPLTPPAAAQRPGRVTPADLPLMEPRPTYRGRAVDESSDASFDVIDSKNELLIQQKRRGDRIGGAVIGLITGVAVCAIAYVSGALSGPTTTGPTTPPGGGGGSGQPAVAQVEPPDGKKLLAAGDPAGAWAALEKTAADAPADVKAARGEARWLTRLRELAAAGTAPAADDAAFKQAETDLTAAAADSDKTAAVRAALNLGLMKEMTGDAAGAEKVYADAAAKFPDSKRVFDAALSRLKVMADAPARNDGAKLAPRPAAGLLRAAVFAAILLQPAADPAPKADGTDEPGFLFWQAVSAAAAGRYDDAIAGVAEARKLHDRKRLLVAGRGGINPLSDPLDQIFLKACDDLKAYWTLRRDLYQHPKLGETVKKDGVTKALDELAAVSESAKEYPAKLRQLTEEAEAATAKMKIADDAAKKLQADNEAMAKDLQAATANLDDKLAKLEAADDQLAAVVAELKANGHLKDGDEAKLAVVVKSVAAAAASDDARRATEAMLAARRDADAARAEAKTAADKVADLTAKLNAAEKKAADDVAAARQQAALEAARRERDLRARIEAADDVRKRELAAQEEKFTQMLADVRLRARVPESAGERYARERATKAFADGYGLYLAGRFADAEAKFAAAVKDDAGDARYWYFLGLARWVQGKGTADEAFRKGAELEARNRPSVETIGASLERIQGPARQMLAAYRP